MKHAGIVVAAHGRQYQVEWPDGKSMRCFPRGKKSSLACGDAVEVESDGADGGVIVAVAPRTSLLYRSNEHRQKLIAANVTQIVVVIATEPTFSTELLTRCLVAAESQKLRALIVLNKCDLGERLAVAAGLLEAFEKIGYPVLHLSARLDADALRPFLIGQKSVLVGQSGMGKSTLINALVPGAKAVTREISTALDSGKHATTHATLYRLDGGSALIDSPGLQEFGLKHLSPAELEHAFPELRPWLGQCRFRNCRHDQEPACAVHAAAAAGAIDTRRYAAYQALRAASAHR